jgi:hypothetical protein
VKTSDSFAVAASMSLIACRWALPTSRSSGALTLLREFSRLKPAQHPECRVFGVC